MYELLQDYLQYNLWANRRLAEQLDQISLEHWEQDLGFSFPNLKQTLLHFMDAEMIWLKRLQGQSLQGWPSAALREDPSANFESIRADFLRNSEELIDIARNKPASWFESPCGFKSTEGNPHRMIAREILQHVVNHSGFHRGQIIAGLRVLGYTGLPSTDFITWARQRQQERNLSREAGEGDSELKSVYGA